MRRLAAVVMTALAVATAAGCGSGSSGSSGPPPSASALIRRAGTAIGKARAVAFDLTVHVSLKGHASGAGSTGALLSAGPITLAMRGQVETGGRFSSTFAINAGGLSLSGKLLSANGRVGYVQAPAFLGPGWHVFPMPSTGSSTAGMGSVDPATWLKHATVTAGSGTDTLAAQLNLAALMAQLGRSSAAGGQAAAASYGRAVRDVHGSATFDSSTDLPTRAAGTIQISLPASMTAAAGGLRGATLDITVTFPSWNSPFSVTAPSGAKPVSPKMLSGLLSGL